jgi:hypothetical protein
MEPPPGQSLGGHAVLRALLLRALNTFATPNAENTRDLLLHVGFDPWPSWQWQEGRVQLSKVDVRDRLNHWLQVRHAIAHGDDLPDVPVLARTGGDTPTLRLRRAEACIRFFERLASVTVQSLSQAFA